MNILLVYDSGLSWGGVCQFMLQWIRGVKEADRACSVFVYFRRTVYNENARKEYEKAGAKIILGNMSAEVNTRKPQYRAALRRDIRQIIKDKRIDVVHVNSGILGFVYLVLSEAKRADVAVRIAHCHGRFHENLLIKVIHSALRVKVTRLATVYAGCSVDAGEYLYGKKGVRSPKWQFVPDAIQTAKFVFSPEKRARNRAQIGVREDEILLGAVGRLDTGKNHAFLLPVVAELGKRGQTVRLLILGEGMLRADLEIQAEELGIRDHVILYGSTDDVSGWLSAMDYYLMPSLSEGLSISSVEAQANGLVCFLSDRIPKEVDLCDGVYHLSINNGSEPWVRQIMHTSPRHLEERKNGVKAVREAGFDTADMPGYVRRLYGWK